MKKVQIASMFLLALFLVLGLGACADPAVDVGGAVATDVSADVAADTVTRLFSSGGDLSASINNKVSAALAGRAADTSGIQIAVTLDGENGGSVTVQGTATMDYDPETFLTYEGNDFAMLYTLNLDLVETFNDYIYVAEDGTSWTVTGSMDYTVALPVDLDVTVQLLPLSCSYSLAINGSGTQTGTLTLSDGTQSSDAVVDLDLTQSVGGSMSYDITQSLSTAAIAWDLDLALTGLVNSTTVNKTFADSFSDTIDFSFSL